MAVIALLTGSFLGFSGGLFSWLFLDLSLLTAIGLYFTTSIAIGLLPLLTCLVRGAICNSQIVAGIAR